MAGRDYDRNTSKYVKKGGPLLHQGRKAVRAAYLCEPDPRGGPRNFQGGGRGAFQEGERGVGFSGGNRRSLPTHRDFSSISHYGSNSAQSSDFRITDQRGGPLQQSPINLYRIKISLGTRYTPEYILQTLAANSLQTTINPLQYHTESQHSVFYVTEHAVAEALKQCSGRITTNLNLKLIVSVEPAFVVPPRPITPDMLDKLRQCLTRRYDAIRKNLDLSRFAADAGLMLELISLPLTRTVNHNAVFKMVLEMFVELESLDVSDNRLQNLSLYTGLWEKLPRLRALNLSANQLCDERELDKLSWAKGLEDIAINGNPFFANLTNPTEWTLNFRRKFPKLRILDGVVLPPQASFAIEHQDLLYFPQSQPNYFGTAEKAPQAIQLIQLFLQQYYGLYDASDREPLRMAYSEESLFSVTCFINNLFHRDLRQPHFVAYAKDMRKFRSLGSHLSCELTLEDLGRCHRTLHKGADAIISCLRRLPPTRHHLTTFAIDVILNEFVIIFSVSGYFKEMPVDTDRIQPTRSFSRLFVAALRGNWLVIQNDMLTISNASREMMKRLRNLERVCERAAAAAATTFAASSSSMASAPANLVVNVPAIGSGQPATVNVVSTALNAAPALQQPGVQFGGDPCATASAQQHLAVESLVHSLAAVTIAPRAPLVQPQRVLATGDPQEREREAAILTLSQHTGLNLVWARKCLEENRWDLNASLAVVKTFLEHNSKAIPQEAFA